MFTLSQTPYPEIDGIGPLLAKLKKGYRLEKPEFAEQQIFDIMLDCWKENRKDRPVRLFDSVRKNNSKFCHKAFAVLEDRFGAMLHETVKMVSTFLIKPHLMKYSNNNSSAIP